MHPPEREDMKPPDDEPILVWDLATRLFHWLLVTLVITSFFTAYTGGAWIATPLCMWVGIQAPPV